MIVLTQKYVVPIAIAVCVFVFGMIAYVSDPIQFAKDLFTPTNTGSPEIGSMVSMEGTIVSIDHEKLQFVIKVGTDRYTIALSTDTRIHKSFVQKLENEGNRRYDEELNIEDLHSGDAVTITATYSPESVKDGLFVAEDIFAGTEEWRAIEVPEEDRRNYIEAEVVSFDPVSQTLAYRLSPPYVQEVMTATIFVTGLPVYRVTDLSQANMRHARLPVTNTVFDAGQRVVIVLGYDAVRQGMEFLEIVISE